MKGDRLVTYFWQFFAHMQIGSILQCFDKFITKLSVCIVESRKMIALLFNFFFFIFFLRTAISLAAFKIDELIDCEFCFNNYIKELILKSIVLWSILPFNQTLQLCNWNLKIFLYFCSVIFTHLSVCLSWTVFPYINGLVIIVNFMTWIVFVLFFFVLSTLMKMSSSLNKQSVFIMYTYIFYFVFSNSNGQIVLGFDLNI